MTRGEDGDRLAEQMLATLNAVDPGGLYALVADDEDHPGPAQEQRTEAEEIVRRIGERERDGKLLGAREIAKIARAVVEDWLEVKVSRKDARAIANRFCARRLVDLLREAIAAEAAAPLADGRAVLRIADDEPEGDRVELLPTRPTAAGLSAFVEYDALVNCFVAGHYTHEIFSNDPNELLGEVRILARALVAGTYAEEERDKGSRATVRAIWPDGGSTTFTFGSGIAQDGWQRRAYDPY